MNSRSRRGDKPAETESGVKTVFYADFFDAPEIYESLGLSKGQFAIAFKKIHRNFNGILTVTPVRQGRLSSIERDAATVRGQVAINPSGALAAFLLQNSERPPGSGMHGDAAFEVTAGEIRGLPAEFQKEMTAIIGLLKLVGATPAKENRR